jgi:hypothetical protein
LVSVPIMEPFSVVSVTTEQSRIAGGCDGTHSLHSDPRAVLRGSVEVMKTVKAILVGEGDTLVDLGGGYVIDVDPDPVLCTYPYNTVFAPECVLITFHDENGDENHLMVQHDLLLRIE